MEDETIRQGQETHPGIETLLDYITARTTEETGSAVEEWMQQDASHEKEVMQLASIYYALQTKESIRNRDYHPAFMKVQQRIKGKIRRIWLRRAVMAAACIAGMITLSTIFSYRMNRREVPVPQRVTVQSAAGMRTHFNLPDGTSVHLNAGSELSYPLPFGGDERRVTLAGEAYFKVSHDPDCPFIVSTVRDYMSVQVHGTAFNVEAYEADRIAAVTLVEGKVDVLLNKNEKPLVSYTLSPSEKMIYDLERDSYQVARVDASYDMAWTTGQMAFKNTPLPEVLRKLSHFYDVEFEVKDKIINTYSFTGTFKNRPVTQVLDYLKISSRIDYTLVLPEEDDSNGVRKCKMILYKMK